MPRLRALYLAGTTLALFGCGEDKPPAAPPPPAPVAQLAIPSVAADPVKEFGPSATVLVSSGAVEVRRGGQGGWISLQVGDKLVQTDEIRTLRDGKVELGMTHAKVRIHERSEFSVKVLTETLLRGRLKGRLDSNVEKGRGRLEIEAAGSDAVAQTDDGHFAMTSDGRGVVAVSTVSGGVQLSAAGATVDVKAGQVTHVAPGKKPKRPTAALKKVLLSVAWPTQRLTNKSRIPLTGKTEPGSEVLVRGAPVAVGPDGTFQADVALRPGKQTVDITVVDVMGRKKQAAATFEHDPTLPKVKVEGVSWE